MRPLKETFCGDLSTTKGKNKKLRDSICETKMLLTFDLIIGLIVGERLCQGVGSFGGLLGRSAAVPREKSCARLLRCTRGPSAHTGYIDQHGHQDGDRLNVGNHFDDIDSMISWEMCSECCWMSTIPVGRESKEAE